MECFQIRERIPAFIDGEVDETTSRAIETHLDGCSGCLEYLRGLEDVDDLVRGLPTLDLSPDFTSRVVSAIIGTSDAAGRETVSYGSRLKQTISLLLEAVVSLFEPESSQSTRTLDEFSDCPPLSMSNVYFSLLGPGGRGCCDELSL
jgi:hypothetical protein